MKIRVEVTTKVPFADLRSAEAAFVKGAARLIFEAHPDHSTVLERAANVAEEFVVDIYVDGELTDPYEIRDRLENKFERGRKKGELLLECEEEAGEARPLQHPKLQA